MAKQVKETSEEIIAGPGKEHFGMGQFVICYAPQPGIDMRLYLIQILQDLFTGGEFGSRSVFPIAQQSLSPGKCLRG